MSDKIVKAHRQFHSVTDLAARDYVFVDISLGTIDSINPTISGCPVSAFENQRRVAVAIMAIFATDI
jgi:hypothetical protein